MARNQLLLQKGLPVLGSNQPFEHRHVPLVTLHLGMEDRGLLGEVLVSYLVLLSDDLEQGPRLGHVVSHHGQYRIGHPVSEAAACYSRLGCLPKEFVQSGMGLGGFLLLSRGGLGREVCRGRHRLVALRYLEDRGQLVLWGDAHTERAHIVRPVPADHPTPLSELLTDYIIWEDAGPFDEIIGAAFMALKSEAGSGRGVIYATGVWLKLTVLAGHHSPERRCGGGTRTVVGWNTALHRSESDYWSDCEFRYGGSVGLFSPFPLVRGAFVAQTGRTFQDLKATLIIVWVPAGSRQ